MDLICPVQKKPKAKAHTVWFCVYKVYDQSKLISDDRG